ncbi:MAG: histidine kinase [Flavobacteriaceae bacterium]
MVSLKNQKEGLFLLFALCSFLFFPCSYSQNSQLQNFTTKEGIPQSQVYNIVQDSIGYLWLATQGGGLARFDGDEFTVFNEKKGLKSNFVNTLLVKNDSLFIGTSSGLSLYAKGKFTNYESPKINKVIYLDSHIYLATDQGIYQYNKGSLQLVKSGAKIDLSIVTDIIKDGRKYLIATKKGVWSLNQIENPTSVNKLDTDDYSSFIKVNGIIIGSTLANGFKLIRNGKILKSYETSLSVNQISFIDQHYWLATNSKGIIKLDINFNRVQSINQNNGIIVNQIHSIVKDKQENIWIGSSGGGLYKLTQNSFQHFDRNSGLKGNRIYAVHKKDHEIWISNSEKGILKIDSLGIQPIDEDNGYLNIKSKTIASDPYDNVWVGTDGKGILVFSKKYIEIDSLPKLTKFNSLDRKLFPNYTLVTDTITTADGLASNWIKKIKSGNGSVWVATYSSGIMEFTLRSKLGNIPNHKISYGAKDGIKDLKINDIAIENSKNGKVWYATKNGNLGHISNGNVRDYYQILEKKISITTLLIKDNEIYLGTLGDGIWIANLQNPREIKKLSGVKNLNSNNIYQLIFDNENNLWAGTEKGVNKIVLDENNSISDVFYFDRSDGFLGIETCQNAIDKDTDGNIWFGTMNGLTKYIPSNNQLKKVKPTISFEKIEVAYEALDSININNYSSILQLKPTENHLSFQFKSVDVNHPKGIEYRWKLDKKFKLSNSEYNPWGSKDFIDFANLNSGNYKFTVQARNIDWMESDPISFQFFISKPFFDRIEVQHGIIGVIGLIILFISFYIARRIRKKNKQKISQLALENHLLSLEQKALQLQMNPHFIFNVLNGIKAMGTEGETQEMNTTINTFASLLRSILNSSRQEEISLQEEVKTLKNYLTLEQQMNANSFKYTIDVKTNDIDSEEILIPPMLIQPFVENSIKHGFKNLNYTGEISILFHVKKDFLHCEVKDNGIGINQSKSEKQSHQSMAMQVTKERIESLSGVNSLLIKENNGTIVSFRLPLKTDF